mmetsp:Transcript_11080/g.25546  ORF Transcript_11080/g.25546 Transcript_11080/m.25546 type:complete len:93 (-) Transcript_11080:1199-1477(-)
MCICTCTCTCTCRCTCTRRSPYLVSRTGGGVYFCVHHLASFGGMQVDPVVFHMLNEDPGDVSYSSVGGLNEQIRELREVMTPACTVGPFFVS